MQKGCAFNPKYFTILLAYFLFPNVGVVHHKMIRVQTFFILLLKQILFKL
jgi:hypothetical protein